jgi:hypothetical protein
VNSQKKIAIYLGPPKRLRGSENSNFCPRTCCNVYGDLCGLDNPQRQLDTGFKQKLSFSGTSFTMLDLSRRKKSNRKVDVNRANNEQRYIPEIPCHISSEVRGYSI